MEFNHWEHNSLSSIWDAAGKSVSVLKIRRCLAALSVCASEAFSFSALRVSFCLCVGTQWVESVLLSLPVKLHSTKMDAFSYIHDIQGSTVTPKLFNMDAVVADTYTHIFFFIFNTEHAHKKIPT